MGREGGDLRGKEGEGRLLRPLQSCSVVAWLFGVTLALSVAWTWVGGGRVVLLPAENEPVNTDLGGPGIVTERNRFGSGILGCYMTFCCFRALDLLMQECKL